MPGTLPAPHSHLAQQQRQPLLVSASTLPYVLNNCARRLLGGMLANAGASLPARATLVLPGCPGLHRSVWVRVPGLTLTSAQALCTGAVLLNALAGDCTRLPGVALAGPSVGLPAQQAACSALPGGPGLPGRTWSSCLALAIQAPGSCASVRCCPLGLPAAWDCLPAGPSPEASGCPGWSEGPASSTQATAISTPAPSSPVRGSAAATDSLVLRAQVPALAADCLPAAPCPEGELGSSSSSSSPFSSSLL